MQLSGNARINVETGEFGFDLKGTEVKIENLRAVREGKVKVSGQATFAAVGDGTLGAPLINGRLRLRNLAVNGQALGDMDVDAVTHGAQMQVTARSNFKTAEVNLSGVIVLRGQMPMQLTVEVQSANLNPLLEAFLPLRHGAATELKMHAEVTGDALRPRDMTAVLVVEHWVTNYGGITVTNDGPMRLTMANQVVRMEQFRMAGEQGTRFLQLRGEMQLGGKREINLRANGSVNLKVLETADPKLTAGGVANLDLRINGTLSRPSLRGSMKVQNGRLTYQDFPNGLSEITGTLIFNQDRLLVQELTARTGGGLLRCAGLHHVLRVAGAVCESLGQRTRDSVALPGRGELDGGRRLCVYRDEEECIAVRRRNGDAAGTESAIRLCGLPGGGNAGLRCRGSIRRSTTCAWMCM